MSRDPLVVNTKDGVVWQRRAVTRDGHGLYAVTGSCSCPEYLMASLPELAEHGIAGTADVLPVPVGSPAEVPDEDVTPQVRKLRALLAGQRDTVQADGITRRIAPVQALREDPHDGPLAHPYRTGRDLPETGGAR